MTAIVIGDRNSPSDQIRPITHDFRSVQLMSYALCDILTVRHSGPMHRSSIRDFRP